MTVTHNTDTRNNTAFALETEFVKTLIKEDYSGIYNGPKYTFVVNTDQGSNFVITFDGGSELKAFDDLERTAFPREYVRMISFEEHRATGHVVNYKGFMGFDSDNPSQLRLFVRRYNATNRSLPYKLEIASIIGRIQLVIDWNDLSKIGTIQ